MGVRDRGILAALAVAGRSRIGTGAMGADRQRPGVGDAGDRAAAGTDRVDVEHREGKGPIANFTFSGKAIATVLDQADVRRGAADVDANHVLVAGRLTDEARADHPRRRARERRRGGHPLDLLGADHAAIRFHNQQRRRDGRGFQAIFKLRDIARDRGHDIDVEHGRDAALVLAEDPQHVRGNRDKGGRMLRAHDFRRAPFVIRMHETVEITDRHRVHAARLIVPGRCADRRFVEGDQHGPVDGDAFRNFVNAFRQHRPGWLEPGKQVCGARNVLAADLQHMLEARRGQQSDLGPFAFENEVRGDRRAVKDLRQVRRFQRRLPQGRLDPVHEPL